MPALLGTRRVPYLGGAWTPARLPGLVLWLDAATVGQADNTAVATWRDRSGKGNDATQGTVAAQPTYLAAGIGGHPGLQNDAVDDYLATAAPVTLQSAGVTLTTVVAVTSLTTHGIWLCNGVGGATGTSQNGYALGQGNGNADTAGAQLLGLYQHVRWIVTGYSFPAPGVHVVTMRIDASGFPHIYVDGALVYQDTIGAPVAPGAGGTTSVLSDVPTSTRFWGGNLGAVVVCSASLTDAQRLQLERYLGQRWGVRVP